MVLTRGFTGRRRGTRDPRLPPGQYDAGMDWPVLHVEPTPSIDAAGWSFGIDGLVDKPVRWSWEEIHSLPASRYEGAIHCVTTWSKFGMRFDGVSVDTLLDVAGVGDDAAFALGAIPHWLHHQLPTRGPHRRQGLGRVGRRRRPVAQIHGGPARLLVPHLYFWKSAKWVSGLTLLAEEQLGFWEQRGYHDRGDPWLEQRYQGD